MPLESSIKDFGIAEIFQLITIQKKSGILTVRRGDESTGLHFDKGQIAYATSINKDDTKKIGKILIRAGKLTERDVENALQIQEKTGEKLGNILVSLGIITKEDIKEALQVQLKDVIFQILRWKEGEYRFDIIEIEYDKDYQVSIPTDFILMEGVRMLDEWPYIEDHIPSDNMVFYQCDNNDLETLFSSLSSDELSVYNLVDGIRNVREIIAQTQHSDFDVYKILLSLKLSGVISDISSSKMDEESNVAEKDREKRRLKIAIQIAIIIFIISFILFLLPFGEMAGINEIISTGRMLKWKQAEKKLSYLHRSIGYYYLVNGVLPGSIDILFKEQYVRKGLTTDPWGIPFAYEKLSTDKSGRNAYRLYSKGADTLIGTQDDIF